MNLYKLTKNSLYLTLMRRQHNTVNSMIESAKKEYISALLDNNSSCPKKVSKRRIWYVPSSNFFGSRDRVYCNNW